MIHTQSTVKLIERSWALKKRYPPSVESLRQPVKTWSACMATRSLLQVSSPADGTRRFSFLPVRASILFRNIYIFFIHCCCCPCVVKTMTRWNFIVRRQMRTTTRWTSVLRVWLRVSASAEYDGASALGSFRRIFIITRWYGDDNHHHHYRIIRSYPFGKTWKESLAIALWNVSFFFSQLGSKWSQAVAAATCYTRNIKKERRKLKWKTFTSLKDCWWWSWVWRK